MFEDLSDEELDAAIIREQSIKNNRLLLIEPSKMTDEELDNAILEEGQTRQVIEPKKDNSITSEEALGFNRLYDVADKLKYLDNLRSKAFASTIGPMIDIGKGVDPTIAMGKEYSSWEPQASSSFMGRFREAFPSQKPIMDTPAEDIAQGEPRLAAFKTFAQKEFPRAYGAVSGVVPSDVPGAIADTLTGNLVLPRLPQASTVNALDELAQSGRERGLLKNSGAGRLEDIEKVNTKKMQIIGNTLNEYGIADQIHDPEKLHSTLNGEYEIVYDAAGRQKGKPGYGLINELTDSVKDAAQYFTNQKYVTDIKQIANDIINKMAGESSGQNSLVDFSAKDRSDLINKVQSKLRTNVKGGVRTVGDLIEIKRNAADAIYELKSNASTYGVQGVTDLKINKAIWSAVDSEIENLMNIDPNAKSFIKANGDLSNLLHARDMVAGAKTSKLMGSTMVEALGTAGLGLTGGSAIGRPVLGASIGGGFGALKAITKDISSQLPSRGASLAQNAADYLRPRKGLSALSSVDIPISAGEGRVRIPTLGSGAMTNIPNIINPQDNAGRFPQSVPDLQQQAMMRRGLVENLADYEIPRNSRDVLDQKQLVIAKVAQISNDPKFTAGLEDALNKHPDKVEEMLKGVSLQFPQLMVADKYNRINGKIFDVNPQVQQMIIHQAYQKIKTDGSLSNSEKAILWNGLNRDGTLPDSYK
jgi:hypothetical protein